MYIHLGSDVVISAQEILAIINIESPISEDIVDLIDYAKHEKLLVYIGDKRKGKALIICDNKYYMSPISSSTLLKRSMYFY